MKDWETPTVCARFGSRVGWNETRQRLKQWKGKTTASVIFDSNVDEFTDDRLFHKFKGKRNVAVIGFSVV